LRNKKWKRGSVYEGIECLFPHALFVLEGEKWRRHRNLMHPFFNTQSIKNFYENIKDIAIEHINITKDQANQEMNLKTWTSSYTLKIMNRISFGIPTKDSENISNQLN